MKSVWAAGRIGVSAKAVVVVARVRQLGSRGDTLTNGTYATHGTEAADAARPITFHL
jgi:hypothetical protein